MSIVDILVQKKMIQKKDAVSIMEESRLTGESLEQVLSKHGVSSEMILSAKSEEVGIPTRSAGKDPIPFEVLQYIPEESAAHYGIIPLSISDGVLEVGITNPDDIEARDALNFIASRVKMPYKLFLISDDDFKQVLNMYRGLSGEVTKALTELETDIKDVNTNDTVSADMMKHEGSVTRLIEDAPVTKIVATILRYAVEGGASDIHVERMVAQVRVRFRVDGDLQTSLVLPIKVHDAVVARIKILSNMKLDEKRKPQDGRFSARIEDRKVDFRVSTFPAYYGEKVVMRILDQEKGVQTLETLGFSPYAIKAIRDGMKKPYGLILISGPTGSGKSTTLYAMLKEINDDTKNVLSLEDPVEYNMEGVNQSQVRPEIGYTFATGLRTTLRQDPDIIMVGEIRDRETAQLAIQAALTGHLVLSTIHTNSAIGVVPRLVDMGVDPYLIAPTLVLAMAQRLVSKLCTDGGKEIPVEGSIKMLLEKSFSDMPGDVRKNLEWGDKVWEPSPTATCPTGVKGRTVVSEIVPFGDPEFERVILKDPTEDAIYKIARSKGLITMKEDAAIKAMRREIPLSEFNRL